MLEINTTVNRDLVFENLDVKTIFAADPDLLSAYNGFCFQWLNGQSIFAKLAYLYSFQIEENGVPVIYEVINSTIKHYVGVIASGPEKLIRPCESLLIMVQSLIKASRSIISLSWNDRATGERWHVGVDVPFSMWIINRPHIEYTTLHDQAAATKAFYETVVPENMKLSLRAFHHEKQILDVHHLADV